MELEQQTIREINNNICSILSEHSFEPNDTVCIEILNQKTFKIDIMKNTDIYDQIERIICGCCGVEMIVGKKYTMSREYKCIYPNCDNSVIIHND